ncbi:5-methyltetrahydropteroyltriglutamate--homocysteine S-methyltransferase [Candidatus Carsonella ruddii]|uniref:5-methyltetrahydropteroyltriglutamate--homocysteine S-methyltransferase n=1 Tax=Candidatus Carsonella ruddii CE isolate Thao2000 TaxID=1202536 RepID=J7GY61_CARRU|nr:5-methyltetrahydropteroyltriglutamate--homocysteine S-methyltransferase [Candidatus Carsonella ruddii]AFP83498.1 5-methyltetrahydropteroyltriglutamate-- homocysteine S-methyltransferase [Candidatus Carsonella ruddii CE isolate Thao2000]
MNLHLIGMPNIGKYRELKFFTEKFWNNNNNENLINLLMISKKIRMENFFLQINNNMKFININDFSNYDFILDINCMINTFNNNNNIINIKKYFILARGDNNTKLLKMTKFFNTNYHYIIPECFNNLKLCNKKIFNEIFEIFKLGVIPKITLLGPITYLFLSLKKYNILKIINLLEIYIYIIKKLYNIGIKIFQLEEPILCTIINNNYKIIFDKFYKKIQKINLKLILITYFGKIKNFELINKMKKCIIHIDIENFNDIKLLNKHEISLGIMNNNLSKSNLFLLIKKINKKINYYSFNNNCKLIPYDLSLEKNFFLKKYLSFFYQKINEFIFIKKIKYKIINENDLIYLKNFEIFKEKITVKKNLTIIKKKNIIINKKILLSTSIGSFPQNIEIRITRKFFNKKIINEKEYKKIINENTYLCIIKQYLLKFNIITNGEFERTDMVEYFAEKINGMYISKNGWIQSYGTRYVKPPILGNIKDSKNITDDWLIFVKKISNKKIKVILSGPITIYKWSFCINEKYKIFICLKISEIINQEILFLQKKNFFLFQIDEPTIKECLPINKKNWNKTINKILFCFNNCTKFIKKNNEIHTHVCYSVFNDIVNLINKMNIDVITIESTREEMKNLITFNKINVNIGAGVYDIHSPIIPYKYNIKKNFYLFFSYIKINNCWINPDCGLKTRNWFEILKTINLINIIKKTIYCKYN